MSNSIPKTPREVVYHVRPGTEDHVLSRMRRDLAARTDGCPLHLTVSVRAAATADRIGPECRLVASKFGGVTCDVVTTEPASARIAVITPAYNVERFLPQYLDSLLAQTCPVDVFCCDDGSKDGTGRILDEYAARYPRVHALHHPNRGMSPTNNRLLDELPAEYEYVGIVDSDDYVHPEMYDALMTAMACTGADVAECHVAMTTAEDVQPARTSVAAEDEPHQTVDDMSVYWLHRTSPAGWISKWNKLYRRSAIGSFRFQVGLDVEDDYLFETQVNAAIGRKVIVADRFYGYRQNPNSITGNLKFRKYVSSAALRLRRSCELFLVTDRIPAEFRDGWLCDLTKDAYRMMVRKNLKKNRDPALRREMFFMAGEELRKLGEDFGLTPCGLNPMQRLVFDCCLKGRYALASLLVMLT